MKLRATLLVFSFVFLFSASDALAHTGVPLDVEGCHECRARDGCFFYDYWSVPKIFRHCHAKPEEVSADLPIHYLEDAFVTSTVISVLEGDVIEVRFADRSKVEVQLFGVQSPDTHETHEGSECRLSREEFSQARLEEIVLDEVVGLRRNDVENARKDRLLRSVFFAEEFVNEEVLFEGFAYSDLPVSSSTLTERLKAAEIKASEAGLGLWDEEFCEKHRLSLLGQLSVHARRLALWIKIILAVVGVLGIYFISHAIRRSREEDDEPLFTV